jgi:hypothetical protein
MGTVDVVPQLTRMAAAAHSNKVFIHFIAFRIFKLLFDFGAIVKNGSRYECPGVIEGSFFKKDFAKIFAEHEQEYIDKLQPIMDKIEEDIRKKRLSINISDLSEFEEEETEEQEAAFEDSVKNMLAEMQAEDEVAADKAREE